MKFYLIGLLLLVNVLFPLGNTIESAQAEEELTGASISGESAILIDGTTGQILFEKNVDARLYPASITKIATGIYAIEHGNPDDIVTVSKRARNEEGTRVYLAEGEQVPLSKLEYGLLMNSGNDAATAIAEHMSGSVEKFAEELNQFLHEKIGVENTHFANAHGLHDPNHYTTAADMAKIARYAMKNPIFREIVATKKLPWDGKEWKTTLVNHNKMLWSYEGTTGIKNGFTDEARNTLVESAKRGESEFIAVTMKAHSSAFSYKDVTKMLDYAFAHFETKQVARAGEHFVIPADAAGKEKLDFYTNEPLYITVPLGSNVQTEVTPAGRMMVQAGTKHEEFPLLKVEAPVKPIDTAAKPNAEKLPENSSLARYILLISWLLLNVLLVLYAVARTRKKRKSYEYRRRADWS